VHHDALLPSRENLGQPNPDKTQFKNIRVGEDVMPNEPDDGARRTVSRRHLFKQAAGVAAALSATTPALVTAQPVAAPTPPAPKAQASRLEALETLTAAEADTLEAIVARLIPSDANGPGATEARAAPTPRGLRRLTPTRSPPKVRTS
jgi:hypothetical protein